MVHARAVNPRRDGNGALSASSQQGVTAAEGRTVAGQ